MIHTEQQVKNTQSLSSKIKENLKEIKTEIKEIK